MGSSSNISAYEGIRHYKLFTKALDVVHEDLGTITSARIEVEIHNVAEAKSMLRRFIEGIDIKTVDQVMILKTMAYECPVEIHLSMVYKGWWLPLSMYVVLPVGLDSAMECRKAMMGRKWMTNPSSGALASRIDKVLPKTRSRHVWQAMMYELKVFYVLEPEAHEQTIWCINTGFKQGMFKKPKLELARYLDAIPDLVRELKD